MRDQKLKDMVHRGEIDEWDANDIVTFRLARRARIKRQWEAIGQECDFDEDFEEDEEEAQEAVRDIQNKLSLESIMHGRNLGRARRGLPAISL